MKDATTTRTRPCPVGSPVTVKGRVGDFYIISTSWLVYVGNDHNVKPPPPQLGLVKKVLEVAVRQQEREA